MEPVAEATVEATIAELTPVVADTGLSVNCHAPKMLLHADKPKRKISGSIRVSDAGQSDADQLAGLGF